MTCPACEPADGCPECEPQPVQVMTLDVIDRALQQAKALGAVGRVGEPPTSARNRAAFLHSLAMGIYWTEAEQDMVKPKRHRVDVELPFEAVHVTDSPIWRQAVAERLREAAALVEAGYNLQRAHHDDYRRALTLTFEQGGKPLAPQPQDNSPALGGDRGAT